MCGRTKLLPHSSDMQTACQSWQPALLQLVSEEETGGYTAPEEQGARRASGGSSGSPRSSHASSPRGSQPGGGRPAVNVQSGQRGDAAGRLWAGDNGGGGGAAADGGSPHDAGPPAPSAGGPSFQHFSLKQRGAPGSAEEEEGDSGAESRGAAAGGGGGGAWDEMAPGRRVGELMRRKIEDEGWAFIVEGHRRGAQLPCCMHCLCCLCCLAPATAWPVFACRHPPANCLPSSAAASPPPLQPGRRRRRAGQPAPAGELSKPQMLSLQLPWRPREQQSGRRHGSLHHHRRAALPAAAVAARGMPACGLPTSDRCRLASALLPLCCPALQWRWARMLCRVPR